MRLTKKPKPILLKKKDMHKLTTGDKKAAYARENTLISIKTTRLENIMIHLFHPFNITPPIRMDLFFFEVGFGGSSMHPCHLEHIGAEEREDKKVKRLRILNTGTWNMNTQDLFVSNIGFSSDCLESDFEFFVEVHLKWTYQIRAKNLYEEFWFPDGNCHHEIGDNFPHHNKKNVELIVRDKNEKLGIVYCAAEGFI